MDRPSDGLRVLSRPSCVHSNKLTDDEVKAVLLSDLPDRELGKRFGMAASSIYNVRRGRTYGWLWPEIPRLVPEHVGPDCSDCVHFDGRCSMGFPEYRSVGSRYAARCAAFFSSLPTDTDS